MGCAACVPACAGAAACRRNQQLECCEIGPPRASCAHGQAEPRSAQPSPPAEQPQQPMPPPPSSPPSPPPADDAECYSSHDASDYRGSRNGQRPHLPAVDCPAPKSTPVSPRPRGVGRAGLGDRNYCRRPGGLHWCAFCYVSDRRPPSGAEKGAGWGAKSAGTPVRTRARGATLNGALSASEMQALSAALGAIDASAAAPAAVDELGPVVRRQQRADWDCCDIIEHMRDECPARSGLPPPEPAVRSVLPRPRAKPAGGAMRSLEVARAADLPGDARAQRQAGATGLTCIAALLSLCALGLAARFQAARRGAASCGACSSVSGAARDPQRGTGTDSPWRAPLPAQML